MGDRLRQVFARASCAKAYSHSVASGLLGYADRFAYRTFDVFGGVRELVIVGWWLPPQLASRRLVR